MGVLINGNPISGTSTSLTVYKYEPISYILSASGGDTSVTLVSATTLIRTLVSQSGDEVHFEASSGYSGTVSAAESIVVQTSPGGVTYTIGVVINAGRFILTPPLTAFVFNKNTSVAVTYGSPIVFTSPIPISLPRSLTTLPPGIGFVQVDPYTFYLTGTPLAVSPTLSYNILGFGTPDTSKVVSKTITITVNDEIITTSLAGGSNVSNMIVDFPISERVITSVYPNRFSGNLVYTWTPSLPNGIRFIDVCGNTVSSGFAPADVNSTIRLVGTPTLSAAYTFASSNLSNYPVTVRATRQTTPSISASVLLNFSFAETVLFDPVSNVSVYTNAPIPFGTIPFTARTYFAVSPVNMEFIVATDGLPPGLILSYTPGSSNAYLTGTSTGAGAGTYRLTAQNSNGVYRDVSVNIAISTDSVQFVSSPVQDVCYNFIISRPLNQPKTGYYPGSIQYTATAASGSAITYSTANLPAGVTATSSGGVLTLAGIPNTVQTLQTAVITATAASTGADLSRNMNYQVLADTMVVSPTSGLSFFQNQTINRTQFTGTTLSERLITSWSSPNLPAGLSLSSTGFLTGIPTNATSGSATFDVVSSTGYYSQNNTVTYDTIGDNALVLLVNNPSVTTDVFSNVAITVVSYSANPVTTFVSNIFPVQNPPISLLTNSTSTTISGDVTVAGSVYPEYDFSIYTQVSNATIDEQKFRLTTQTPSTPLHYILDVSATDDYIQPTMSTPLIFPKGVPTLYKNVTTATNASNWIVSSIGLTSQTFAYLADFAHSKNRIVFVAGSEMFRTSDISSTGEDLFEKVDSTEIASLPDIVGDYSNVPMFGVYTSPGPLLMSIATNRNSNWVVAGQGFDSNTGTEYSIIRTSTDDGQTWTDVSLSPFVVRSSNTSLYYNNGRYFLAQPNSLYYSDENALTVWTNSGVNIGTSGASMAFSNNTILINDICGDVLVSSNNGTSWSPLNPSPVSTGRGVRHLSYALGTWVASMSDASGVTSYISISNSNTVAIGSNWNSEATLVSTNLDGIDFDGSYFLSSLKRGSNRDLFVDNVPFSLTVNEINTDTSAVFTRRMGTRLFGYSNTAVTISTNSNLATFLQPSKGSYTLFQYVGTNIPVELSPQSNFIYYYGLNLPQGLRIALDPSGVFADISGIPSRFSDGFQSSTVYARVPETDTVAAFPITFRVLVPFVLKKQDNAGSYTAFLRQYVTANGAQASRDSVALPVETRPIGDFMHPGAPMVITDSNCPC